MVTILLLLHLYSYSAPLANKFYTLSLHDALPNSINNILENEYEIPITKGTYRFSAESADETLSRELNVEPGTPLFLIERTTYTIKEKPLYYQKRYYRNDRVAYEMTLVRKGNEPVRSEERRVGKEGR